MRIGSPPSDTSDETATQFSPEELQEIRKALDAALASIHFRNSLQCRRLLEYVIDHTLAGEDHLLRERVIGAEVFGRKPDYEPGEDPVVRVRASEVRKRLAQFYQSPENNAAAVIQIPSGSYRATFSWVGSGEAEVPQSESPPSDSTPDQMPAPLRPVRSKRWRLLAVAVMGLLLIASAALLTRTYLLPNGRGVEAFTVAQPSLDNTSKTPSAFSTSSPAPIRLLAGYTGKPRLDSAGNLWQADNWFHGGGVSPTLSGSLARTSDPQIFDRWRSGDFSYDIPLAPGIYELHLYFDSTISASDSVATFGIAVNGSPILDFFDPTTDAMGENIADERVFRDVSPAKDGLLHISFYHGSGKPSVNAIEILPGTPHKQLPIRLIAQPTSFVDHDGQLWHPDNFYMGGRQGTRRLSIAGSPDPDLYTSERFGHFSYAIPVDTRGRYTLVLHFAELYFGAGEYGGKTVGGRVFKVMCNGTTLLDDFDIFKEAGAMHGLTKTFRHLKPTAQGKLNITFEPMTNFATVSAIEVLEESE